MEIVSLQVSGFNNFPANTVIQFKDQLGFRKGGEISGDEAVYLFKILTGVIFGLTQEEKEKYRSTLDDSKVYTGIVTIDLDSQSLLIERDFGTDIIACMFVSQDANKPLFHGKDNPDSNQSRPYLDAVSKIFPIIHKNTLEKVCLASFNHESDSFIKLLYILNLLITSHFKFYSAESLLNDASQLDIFHSQPIKHMSALENKLAKKEAIEHLIKLQRTADQFESDIEFLDTMTTNYQQQAPTFNTEYAVIQQKFEHLSSMHPIQFRDEVLFWKNLREIKFVSEDNLYQIRQRINDINEMFEHDLAIYKEVQPGFENLVIRYKELYTEVNQKKQILTESKTEINRLEKLLEDYKKTKRVLSFTLPVLIFIISVLIFGWYWLMIIPQSLLMVGLVFSIYGHRNFKIRSQIFRIEEDTHRMQKAIRDLEVEMTKISISNRLFTNIDLIDSHVDRYRKYTNLCSELKLLEKEDVRLKKLLESQPYTKKIPEFIEKYAAVVDIDRDDLEEYIERIVKQHEDSIKFSKQPTYTEVKISELDHLSTRYNQISSQLKKMYTKIMDRIHIEKHESNLGEILEKISTEIKTQILESNLN